MEAFPRPPSSPLRTDPADISLSLSLGNDAAPSRGGCSNLISCRRSAMSDAIAAAGEHPANASLSLCLSVFLFACVDALVFSSSCCSLSLS